RNELCAFDAEVESQYGEQSRGATEPELFEPLSEGEAVDDAERGRDEPLAVAEHRAYRMDRRHDDRNGDQWFDQGCGNPRAGEYANEQGHRMTGCECDADAQESPGGVAPTLEQAPSAVFRS